MQHKSFTTLQKSLITGSVLAFFGAVVFLTTAVGGTKIGDTLNLASTAGSLNYGLVGHWTFDGTDMPAGQVNDVSGNGYHGSHISMATSTAYVQGAIGQGFRFDGSDDAVNVGDQNAFSPVTTGTFTVSIWIRPETLSAPDATEQGIFTKMAGSSNEWQFRIQNNNTLQWTVVDNTNSTLCADGDEASSLTVNAWHHLVGVFDGASCVLYVNTVSQGGDPVGGSGVIQSNGTASVYVGMRSVGTRPYKGVVDDARIYNRALSLDEIKHLYQLGATTKVATTPTPSSAQGGLNYGLVGHWTFDGKDMITGQVNDVSGQGNHGSQANMATSTAYTRGAIGQALNFDGTNDIVNIADSSVHSPVTTGAMSVSAWVRPDTLTPAEGSQNPVSKGAASNYEWALQIAANGFPEFVLFQSGGTNYCVAAVASNGIATSTWVHLVGVYTGSDCILYINAVSRDSGNTISGSLTDGTAPLRFGRRADNNRVYDGSVDDVRIYNRAVSLDEIKHLYQLGATTKVNTTPTLSASVGGINNGLVGHYTFDGKDLVTGELMDASGTGNTGSLVNMSTSTSRVKGVLGQGLQLDGSNDYVAINPVANDSTADFSLSGWVKIPPVCTSTKICTIIGRNTSGGGNNFIFTVGDNVGGSALDNELAMHDGSSSAFEGDTDTVVADNTWHHVGYSLSGTTGTLFVDGVARSTHTLDSTRNATDLVSIGQEWDTGTPTDFLPGIVDDIRFYNRALAADEMKALYQMGQ